MRLWQLIKHLYWHRYTSILFRCVVGGVFFYASLGKIAQPEAFAQAIYNYQLLPAPLVNLMAVVLPWIEGVCGLLMIVALFQKGSGVIISALLGIFMCATTVNLIRGLDIACGCFELGPGATRIGVLVLVQEALLMMMSLQLALRER